MQIATNIQRALDRSGLTQDKAAERLEVDVRTFRRWLANEMEPNDKHKEQLLIVLHMEPESLGLARKQELTPAEIAQHIQTTKDAMEQANFQKALRDSDSVLYKLDSQADHRNIEIHKLHILAEYQAGLVASIAEEAHLAPQRAAQHYAKVGQYAQELPESPTRQGWLCLSGTYTGEMLRRVESSSPDNVISIMSSAPHDSALDPRILGNWHQLFARTLAEAGKIDDAREQLRIAQRIAEKAKEEAGEIYICFNPCSVYEEFARFYMGMGNFARALEYIDRAAEYVSTLSPRWQIPVFLTKGEILIQKGLADAKIPLQDRVKSTDCLQGKKQLRKGAKLARKAHHQRQLWRLRTIGRQIHTFATANLKLSEELNNMLFDIENLGRF
jgi:tetratricopeptide (TPR) repeat protein